MTQRPIKFRAWDKVGRRMFDVPALWFNKNMETTIMGMGVAGTADDDLMLMQFTGLHDKNGKEIWEGDIIRCSLSGWTSGVEAAEVIYENGAFRINVLGRGPGHKHLHDDVFGKPEVIGNIYENPELLKS